VNTTLSILLLLSVPGLPLLLLLPTLRSRLSRPCHLALLPAVMLLVIPEDLSIELSWLLFGTGLGIDATSRLLLAMSVVLWIAATFLHPPSNQAADNRYTSFFLLTMAGNLGTILATDVVGFFTFSTLMGYGFYGLLVADGNTATRRAGRVYLGFLIVADLVLFEVLLIAATASDDLGFEVIRHVLDRSAAPGFYLTMVLAGFALKAGVWPLHFWLPLAFRSARPAVVLLLGGVVVAIGLLRMVRWFPLGDLALPGLGAGIQWLGLTAAIYGTVAGLLQAHPRTVLAYSGIVVTSLFVTALGCGLEWPIIGSAIKETAHPFILYSGLMLAALISGSLLVDKIKARHPLNALRLGGHAAGALLLALAPAMVVFLAWNPAADPLIAASGMVALWPWWTLCTTLLAVRWLYLLPHHQQELVSVSAPVVWIIWGVLLAATVATGLLAVVWSGASMGVVVDLWWPLLFGILIGSSAWWLAVKNRLPAMPTIPPGDCWPLLETGLSRVHHWLMSMGFQVLPRWRTAVLSGVNRLLQSQTRVWQNALNAGERTLRNWTLAITLLLLTGITIALLST
jgi:multicomponent K+:H+ antiporter subunit D